MNSVLERPTVWLPAPAVTALAILLGYGLNDVWPAEVDPPAVLHALAWLHNLIGIGLILWCFLLFIQRRTTIVPNRPVKALVIAGPYRFSRNPMYLGLALVHLGTTMATGIIWYLATFVLATLATQRYVIEPEERYLQEKFGPAYRDYCLQVPRWF